MHILLKIFLNHQPQRLHVEFVLLATWSPLEEIYAVLVLSLVDFLFVVHAGYVVNFGFIENLEESDGGLDLDEAVAHLRHHLVRV